MHLGTNACFELMKSRNSLNPYYSDPVWKCCYNQPTLQVKKLRLRGQSHLSKASQPISGGVLTQTDWEVAGTSGSHLTCVEGLPFHGTVLPDQAKPQGRGC